MTKNNFTLEELSSLVESRIANREENSYSYELAKEGVQKITRKIGEEALEVVIASFVYEKQKTEKNRTDLIGEICDLFYHNLVLLASQKIEFAEILRELEKRNKKQK